MIKKWIVVALSGLLFLSACSSKTTVKKEVKPDVGPAKDKVAEYMDALQAGDLDTLETIYKDKVYEPFQFSEGASYGLKISLEKQGIDEATAEQLATDFKKKLIAAAVQSYQIDSAQYTHGGFKVKVTSEGVDLVNAMTGIDSEQIAQEILDEKLQTITEDVDKDQFLKEALSELVTRIATQIQQKPKVESQHVFRLNKKYRIVSHKG